MPDPERNDKEEGATQPSDHDINFDSLLVVYILSSTLDIILRILLFFLASRRMGLVFRRVHGVKETKKDCWQCLVVVDGGWVMHDEASPNVLHIGDSGPY